MVGLQWWGGGSAGYPHILALAVQLDLGHLPDTQGYSGLLSEPCTMYHLSKCCVIPQSLYVWALS